MLGGVLGLLCFGLVLQARVSWGTEPIALVGLPSGIAALALLVALSILGIRLNLGERYAQSRARLSPARMERLSAMALPVLLGLLLSAFLSAYWRGTLGTGLTIGGLFPWSDGVEYLRSAQSLIETGYLTEWGSRRPLASAAWATLLAVSGQELRPTQVGMTLVTGACAWFALEQLRRSHGLLAAVWCLCLWASFERHWVITLLSEPIGLAFGALGFGLLWRGAGARSLAQTTLGLFALTLGQCARPGALLILPALLAWSLLDWRDAGWRRISLLGCLAVGGGFALNTLLLRAIGDPRGSAFSNFSYVLYALAAGGQHWKQVLLDHADLSQMGDSARAARIYRLALERLTAAPWLFALGLIRSARLYLAQGVLGAMLPAAGIGVLWLVPVLGGAGFWLWQKGRRPLRLLLGGFAFLIGVVPLLRSLSDAGNRPAREAFALASTFAVVALLLYLLRDKGPHARLLLAGNLGILLSAPFIGALAYYVSAATMLFLFAPAALVVARFAGTAGQRPAVVGRVPPAGVTLVGLMVALAVVAPLGLHWSAPGKTPVVRSATCAEGQTPVVLRWTSGLRLRGASALQETTTAMDQVTLQRASPPAPELQAFLSRWGALREVHHGYDLVSGQPTWVLLSRPSDPSWLGRYVRLCGEVRGIQLYRSVIDPQLQEDIHAQALCLQ